MINSNATTSDASTAGQQGLAGKGKKGKGKSKALFSSLLDILQKGKGNKLGKDISKQTANHRSAGINQAENKGKLEKGITTQLGKESLVSPEHLLTVNKSKEAGVKIAVSSLKGEGELQLKSTELSLADTLTEPKINIEETSADMIAVVQEHALLMQPDKTGAPQQSDVQEAIIALGKQRKQPQTPTQPQQNTNPTASAQTADGQPELLDPKVVSNVLASTSPFKQALKQDLEAVKSGNLISKTSETIETAQISETIQKKLQPILAQSAGLDTQNKTDSTSNLLSANSSKDRLSTQNIGQTVITASTEDESGLKDSIKASQSPIAALQKAPQQSQSPQNSSPAITNTPNAIAAASESSSSSSQQDFGSQSSDIDISMLDTGKTENKTSKGLDFQAQLAYKSQRSFTPADTMLEIVRSTKTGSTTLELQLEPANLGKVQVSIQIDNAKNIQVAFTVDHAASRQALEQQMPQLRIAMAQQGLDLGGFSMQMNQQGGQQEQSKHAQHISSDEAVNSALLAANEETETRIGVNLASNGRLSILA